MRTYRAVNLNVLWFLIVLNATIFIIELVIGGYPITAANEVVNFLGLTPYKLSQQPWTIISNMFVHGSTWHILFNMISLYFLGSFLIRVMGEKSFLAVFFLGGLAGNILFILLAPFSTGIGASGAIYALGGALAVMVPRAPVLVFPLPVPIPLWAAILIFLFLSFVPGIAWQAHLGGLLLGLIAGLIFKKRRRIYYF
ncbi:MAG: rhomboid family intramembrane serine protease [Deltaproteobacteria bacterium]|nr:MAG: rhomboid family intramembrane serine protease [Deltaproteobacteria bacterium]